jgi:hypothetical protein
MKPVTSSETVEIQVKDLVNKKYLFLENLNLRGRKIAYVFSASTDANFKTPLNRTVVGTSNITALQASYLTLRSDNGLDEINKLPLTHLQLIEGTGATGSIKLLEIDRKLDLPKSVIEISDLTNFSTSESFLIMFLYNENEKPSKAINFANVHVETMEIPITQNGPLKYFFPDNEKLRNKKIVKIQLIGSATTVKTPLGNSQQLYYFITLNIAGKERINALPSYFLQRDKSQINELVFDNILVDWPKSFITLPAVQSSASYAACMEVYYKD